MLLALRAAISLQVLAAVPHRLHRPAHQLPSTASGVLIASAAHGTWILALILLIVHALVDGGCAMAAVTVVGNAALSLLLLLLYLPDLVEYSFITVKHAVLEVRQAIGQLLDEVQLVIKTIGIIITANVHSFTVRVLNVVVSRRAMEAAATGPLDMRATRVVAIVRALSIYRVGLRLIVDAVWCGRQVAEVLKDVVVAHGHECLQFLDFFLSFACYFVRCLRDQVFVYLFN